MGIDAWGNAVVWGRETNGDTAGDGVTVPGEGTASLRTIALPSPAAIETLGGASIGITTTGELYIWGTYRLSLLGTAPEFLYPVPTLHETPTLARQASMGAAKCFIGYDDLLYCFGRNDQEELGTGAWAGQDGTHAGGFARASRRSSHGRGLLELCPG